ncbi:MAG: thiamine pyrophosphate-dependent enzyme, partial [Bdellovibrionota bacterium]
FGFNAMEFDTAVRHKAPFVCFVANNGGWGMCKHGQGIQFGYDHLLATELGERSYHEVARALGGYGEAVTSAEELPRAIDRALSSDRPACLNVATDPKSFSAATALLASMASA